MALSTVDVNIGKSGLGRRALNKDGISGILFYNASLPTGFATNDRIKKVNSLAEAETLGIVKGSVNFDVHWYHISEAFRVNPNLQLYIGYFAVPATTYDFLEAKTMIEYSGGEIRLLGIYAEALTFASSQVTTIQGVIDGLGAAYKQVSVYYAPNNAAVVAVTGWASVTDLRTLTGKKVTVVIAESGTGYGKTLADAKAYSITALGTALGAQSRAKVQESIGNPLNFNLSNGIEMELPALANGDMVTAISEATLATLKDKGYLVARKYTPDYSGTFFERCPTAIISTSDFAFIENVRVVDKAIRGIRTVMVPNLNSNLYLKSDGKLREDTVGYFEDLGNQVFNDMKAAGEISDGQALVDPDQNVLSTSNLTISGEILPVGVSEKITFNVSLVTKLS